MEKKPNVVIIMADQLRYDVMEMGITPNIRKLAELSLPIVIARVRSACRQGEHFLQAPTRTTMEA